LSSNFFQWTKHDIEVFIFSMIPLKTYHHHSLFIFSSISKPNPLPTFSLHSHFLSLPPLKLPLKLKPRSFSLQRVSNIEVAIFSNDEVKDLSPEGEVYQKTLQLVECSMFAALTGLVYFLSNALAIEVCYCEFKFEFFDFFI